MSRRVSAETHRGSPPPLTAGPGYRMRTAFAALSGELARQLAKHGITQAHYYYLRSLYEQDGLTLVELSAHVGVKPATATGVIDTMAALGLVERIPHATDRRKMQVFLTEEGRALKRPLLRSLEELNKIALDGLTEEQWNAFCDVCDLMVRNLSSSKD
jgi:DNA-binding MarR family transcriptional regulator